MGIRQPPAGSSLVLVKSFHSTLGGKESLRLILLITVTADFLRLRNISLFALLLRAAKVKISQGFQASGCYVTAHPLRQASVPGLNKFHISNAHLRICSVELLFLQVLACACASIDLIAFPDCI